MWSQPYIILTEIGQLKMGGELVIYKKNSDDIIQQISPCFGTMVILLSDQFPYEVLMTNRDRYSIAGWFSIDRPF